MTNVEHEPKESLPEVLERILDKGIVVEVWERLIHTPLQLGEAGLSFAKIQTLLWPEPATLRRRSSG